MKTAVLGAVIGAGLVLLAACWQAPIRPVYAERFASEGLPSGELIVLSTPLGEGRERITVVDPAMHVMSVYHVGGESGQVELKSVRNFHWDLQMLEFNVSGLRPGEIQAELRHR
jgi:hypothetical protein